MGVAGAFSGGLGAVEGGAAGMNASAVSALGTGAMGAVPVTAATTAAMSTAAATVGTAAAKTAAAKVVSMGLSPTLENILKYAVPVAGSVVGGIIQSKSASSAQEAQQKYLQEALDYEKEKDKAALARNEERYQFGKQQEASRYGDFSGRIAPYLATGASANDRMAQLLGLPAAPMTAPPSSSGPPPSAPMPAPVTTGQTSPAPPPQPQPAPAAPQEPLVTMRAPTGETKQVKQSEVAHYKQQGAVEVAA